MGKSIRHDGKAGLLNGGIIGLLVRRSESSSVLALLVLWTVFSIGNRSFSSSYNIFNVFRTSSENFFIAMAQAMVIIVGGMNLSIGGIGAMAAVLAGFCMNVAGLPSIVAALAGIAVGLVCGSFNGLLITKLRINSFVVTLATSFIFFGIVKGATGGYPYGNIPASFTWIAKNDIAGTIPLIFVIMLISIVFFILFFRYSILGRELLATGGSLEAAKMSGINTDRIIIYANILSGLLASLVGLFTVARMSAASPLMGEEWMITSFAVAVIGGTALSGGKISMIGMFAAAILITIIKNGLVMMKVNVFYLQAFLGVLIIAAVILEVVRARYNERMKL
jgi:ribose transport system permease protein